MRKILLGLIRVYKLFLSPLIGGQCRFYPSCSEYAGQAVQRHGVWTAAALSVKRILRCNPWNAGGVDFVP